MDFNFRKWTPKRHSRKPLNFDEPRKKRSVLDGVPPQFRQIAFDRLAILRELNRRFSEPRRPGSKHEVIRRFLADFHSGILWPDRGRPIPGVSRASLYNWLELYKKGGLAELVPKYKIKYPAGKADFQPLLKPFEMKFPGPPRSCGKAFFIERLKRRWKHDPVEYAVRLSILFYMPIPKELSMKLRGKALRQEVPHVLKPNLDALNAFVVNCLVGTVFKNHSQIIQFRSEKLWGWWPHTRISIKKG